MDPRIIEATRNSAEKFNLPLAHALAFVEVESNGRAFVEIDGVQKPLIRWEGHYFYRRLKRRSDQALEAAVGAGLAGPNWKSVKNSRHQERRYAVLDEAVQLCADYGLSTDLPYECISIGLGQVMGSHWEDLGYDSAQDMLESALDDYDFEEDAEDQIDMMFQYLLVNDLMDDAQRGSWTTLARGYNGPAYATHGYHTKLEQAAARWARKLSSDDDLTQMPTIRQGSRTRWAVKAWQEMLRDNGYQVGSIDGSFGPATRDATLAFQADQGLTTDGVVGRDTWEAMEKGPAPRAVSSSRAETTASDLRAQGSRQVSAGDALRAIGIAGGSAGGLSLTVENAEDTLDEVSRWTQLARDAKGMLDANWELAFLGLAAVTIYLGWKVVSTRVDEARSGANMSK